MKKNTLVRSALAMLCSLSMASMFCLDAPAFAQSATQGFSVEKVAWNDPQGSQQSQSAWGNSNSGSTGSSSWGKSNSNSNSNSGGSSWGNSNSGNSGSSWGNSNSNANTNSNSGSSSWGNSKSNSNSGGSTWGNATSGAGNKQTNIVMPDPLKQISYAEYQNMVGQYRGKIVVVNFFATWCGPCRQEIADLKVLRTKISTDDLIIISVSVDDNKSDLSAMLREENFNYPTAWASNDLRRAFNIQSIPRMVIYDREGSIWVDQEGLVPRERFFDIIQRMVNF